MMLDEIHKNDFANIILSINVKLQKMNNKTLEK